MSDKLYDKWGNMYGLLFVITENCFKNWLWFHHQMETNVMKPTAGPILLS